jgi:hypothetical protein
MYRLLMCPAMGLPSRSEAGMLQWNHHRYTAVSHGVWDRVDFATE